MGCKRRAMDHTERANTIKTFALIRWQTEQRASGSSYRSWPGLSCTPPCLHTSRQSNGSAEGMLWWDIITPKGPTVKALFSKTPVYHWLRPIHTCRSFLKSKWLNMPYNSKKRLTDKKLTHQYYSFRKKLCHFRLSNIKMAALLCLKLTKANKY